MHYFIFDRFFQAIFIYFHEWSIVPINLVKIFLKFKNIIKNENYLLKNFNNFYNIINIIDNIKCYLYFISKNVKIFKHFCGGFFFFQKLLEIKLDSFECVFM